MWKEMLYWTVKADLSLTKTTELKDMISAGLVFYL